MEPAVVQGGRPGAPDAGLLAGAQVRDLDPGLRQRLELPEDKRGVVVTAVAPASSAHSLGLRPGDVILEVNRVPTPTIDAFRREAPKARERALVLVFRDGHTLFLALSS